MNFEELTPEERLAAEQAVLNLRSLNEACDVAAGGTVLAIAEKIAVEQGRELTRRTLQASVDRQTKAVEKKGRRSGRVRTDRTRRTTDERPVVWSRVPENSSSHAFTFAA